MSVNTFRRVWNCAFYEVVAKLRRTEKLNPPPGLPGVQLKARVALGEAAQRLSAMILKFPEKPPACELEKEYDIWSRTMLGNSLPGLPEGLSRRRIAWAADDMLGVEVEGQEAINALAIKYVAMVYPQVPLDEEPSRTPSSGDEMLWMVRAEEPYEQQMEHISNELLTVLKDSTMEVSADFELDVARAAETYLWPSVIKHAFAGLVGFVGEGTEAPKTLLRPQGP